MKRDRLWFVLSLFAFCACGDDAAQAPSVGAMLAGPYPRALVLSETTRQSLPPGRDAIGDADEALFYWYVPEDEGPSLRFEVHAESTALEPGTVIHRVEETRGAGEAQGMFAVSADALNQGGARMEGGGPRWLQGIYSLHLFAGDRELSTLVFNVQ